MGVWPFLWRGSKQQPCYQLLSWHAAQNVNQHSSWADRRGFASGSTQEETLECLCEVKTVEALCLIGTCRYLPYLATPPSQHLESWPERKKDNERRSLNYSKGPLNSQQDSEVSQSSFISGNVIDYTLDIIRVVFSTGFSTVWLLPKEKWKASN